MALVGDAQVLQDQLIKSDVHPDLVAAIVQHAAATPGITTGNVLQWILTYGLPIVFYLAKLFGWPLPPIPLPPAPPLPSPPVQGKQG